MEGTLDTRRIRRALGWALVAALCASALPAAVTVLNGDFDEDDLRVLGTSLGFAVFSSSAAAGASLRVRAGGWERSFGGLTAGVSATAFLLLVVVLWSEDSSEDLWRAWGVAAVTALFTSHASIVLRARRAGDSPAVRALGPASIGLGAIDSLLVILLIVGAVTPHADEDYPRLLALLLIAFLLTTALPPILRRLQRTPAPSTAATALGAPAPPPRPPEGTTRLEAEALESLTRIEAVTDDPQVRAECARLRELLTG